jgi:hypothetical protein
MLQVRRDEAGKQYLTRADVWSAGDSGGDDGSVLTLFWHALVWGSGLRSIRNEERRMDAIAAEPARAADLLRQAAALAPSSPEKSYELLHPAGKGAITQLGPAFGSKFLYFAGGGAPGHPCLILDKRVATALTRAGWSSLIPSGGWPSATYGRYCALAARWSKELSNAEESVAPDQIEFALFGSRESRSAPRATGPASR